MKILWLFVILHVSLGQQGFGTSYLRNSEVCKRWSCINSKLGLPDTLPPSDQLVTSLRSLLPPDWHGVVDEVVNTCYHDRPRRYTNTCPGQAILHCAVDQLISKCPESYQRKDDACAPVNSLAGFQNMFTQSRYDNIERNIAVERRPAWFLRNYFNTKCCNLPPLFNSTTLSECGFTKIIQYYLHNPTILTPGVLPSQRRVVVTSPAPPPSPPNNGDSLQVVSLKDFLAGNIPTSTDPLDCCDISEFIQPSWRQECNFEMTWEGQNRLVIKNDATVTTVAPEPTSTSKPVVRRDLTIVPQSCEKETCVFSKLNIIANGSVDMDAFTRLLENLTSSQPSWTKGKGRALTTCLRKPLTEYADECEINKVLACTFDVLTENCPNATKHDLCKHSTTERICQISSSKYRPKHRREICILPELVDRGILSECGITSISETKPVTTVIKPKTYKPFSTINKCKDLTPSTTCLLSKMCVLNKYGFVDYFKMKDRIRNYTANKEPSMFLDTTYLTAFNNDLLYSEHCNSPKKLLNVLDSMLQTCPNSRKRNTVQCATTFNQANNSTLKTTVYQENTQRVANHFLHVYFPSRRIPSAFRPKQIRKIKKSPLYHFGILNDNNAPKVTTIDVKPIPKPMVEKPLVEKPLVLLPVYMRIPQSNLMIRRPFIENGVMRSFPMNNPTNNAHIFNSPPISTTPKATTLVSTTPVSPNLTLTHRYSTTRPFSTRFKFPKNEKLDTPIKPE